jgi:tripeptidyl-peptidase-1
VKHYTAPSDESVSAVEAWLSENGIAPKPLVGNGDWVGFTTTVKKAGDLFGAEFSTFKHLETGKEEVRTLAYSIPASLKPHVELVYPMVS